MENKWYYKNEYDIPGEKLDPIRIRDKKCVHCRREMSNHVDGLPRGRWETIEHLNYKRPFNYEEPGFDINKIVFCCGSCNSSRGNKLISEWFKKETEYRKNNVDPEKVSEVVKKYIEKYEQ